MKTILDTTVLIDLLRERNQRRELLAELQAQGDRFFVSAVSVGEVYGGLRAHESAVTQALFSNLGQLPLTPSIAERAGLLKASYARRGQTLGLLDMFIAAMAIEHGMQIMTDNRRHFDLPELTLFPLP